MLKRTLDCSDSGGSAWEDDDDDDDEESKANVMPLSSSSSSSFHSSASHLLSVSSSSSSHYLLASQPSREESGRVHQAAVNGGGRVRKRHRKGDGTNTEGGRRKPRINYRLPENKRKLRAAVKEILADIPADGDRGNLHAICKAVSAKYELPVNTVRDNYLRVLNTGKDSDDSDDDDDIAIETEHFSLSSSSLSFIQTQHGSGSPTHLPTLQWEQPKEHAVVRDASFDESTTKFVQILPCGTVVEVPVMPMYTMRHLEYINVQPVPLQPPPPPSSSSADEVCAVIL